MHSFAKRATAVRPAVAMRFHVIVFLIVSIWRIPTATGTPQATASDSPVDQVKETAAKINSVANGSPVLGAPAVNQWSCKDLDFCDDEAGFEAIRWLHLQLDDDRNGKVDMAESADFFKHDLKHADANERQRQFHGNDKHISVDELWRHWLKSEVHNWTVDQTIEWLVNCVQLNEYVDVFRRMEVNGSTLPRLAVSQNNYMAHSLGIKDPIHRQKLALKAMDVVLFGSPNNANNYIKDFLLATSLLVAMCGCCFAVWQRKHNQAHLKKMLQDMEALQKAEDQLQKLQKELHAAQAEAKADRQTDAQFMSQQSNVSEASTSGLNLIQQLQNELLECKSHIGRLENALAKNQWTPPTQLQHWLQLTHELESNAYNAKRLAADLQLLAAKEACEKLKRKRATLLGSFRVAHGSSIDDVDNRILQAKESLAEITRELQERLIRWRQIERLCGFNIQQNQGQLYLQRQLQQSMGGSVANYPPHLPRTSSDGTITDSDALNYPAVQQLLKHSLNLLLAPGIQPSLYHHVLSLQGQNGFMSAGGQPLIAQKFGTGPTSWSATNCRILPNSSFNNLPANSINSSASFANDPDASQPQAYGNVNRSDLGSNSREEDSSASDCSDRRFTFNGRIKQNGNGKHVNGASSLDDSCSLDSNHMDLAHEMLSTSGHSQSTSILNDKCEKKSKSFRLFSALRKRNTKNQLDE